jgi:hypothetical protein
VDYPDASQAHQVFKFLSLLAALFVPPRNFYSARRTLAQNQVYRRFRQRWLPFPEMQHIERDHEPSQGSSR